MLNETSTDFISQNETSVSIKMGHDINKSEIFFDAKNTNWKEIAFVSIFLIFILIFLVCFFIFITKNKKYICKRKPIGWSYRSNKV